MEASSQRGPDGARASSSGPIDAHGRGRLKIFIGAAAGVGKSYAMLEAARERQAEGVDVVVGWLDTHGRPETEALLAGLEVLPRPEETSEEFPLEAALQRRPELILLDELAHRNEPGSRHTKRWQDVEELLQAGISVYSTLNIQHVESLNDIVARITGTVIQETVPDLVLERASEVELVDLPPDELLRRFQEGAVYLPQQEGDHAPGFFRKGNLIALRELALRFTADRVDAQMQDYRRSHEIAELWPAAERILVCISPSPRAPRLVRAGRRLAAALHAEWIVLYVELPGHLRLPDTAREGVIETLRLAEQSGAEVATLSGPDAAEEILAYARRRNVTRIVVGKPTHPPWRDRLFGSLLEELVRAADDIDVYVSSGDGDAPSRLPKRPLSRGSQGSAYLKALAVVFGCTLLDYLARDWLAEANLVMVYLLGVVFVANRFGRGPAILASVLSVATFDFFFVPPYMTLSVADTEYLVTFGVMLVVALVISTLTYRLRLQAEAARGRELRTAALYAISRDLASTKGTENLLRTAAQHLTGVFNGQASILLPGDENGLQNGAAAPSPGAARREEEVARWVFEHGQMAGWGTATLSGAAALYLPLVASRGTVGVVKLCPADPRSVLSPEQLHLVETFAAQTALALERARLGEEAERSRLQIETERLRSSLLSSVSHDLRTPLATISGATSTLLEDRGALDNETQHGLLQSIYDEAYRLNRLVGNLLDMTRLEAGAVPARRDWVPIEEIIGVALDRLESQLESRPVEIQIDPELPLVPVDDVLIEQVLINLLENAIKYTPPETSIRVSARAQEDSVWVSVCDQGPGIRPGDEERIFDKFYRAPQSSQREGAGLGLAIARAIIESHGGRIWVENLPEGGAAFRFSLPVGETAPSLVPEESPFEEARRDG